MRTIKFFLVVMVLWAAAGLYSCYPICQQHHRNDAAFIKTELFFGLSTGNGDTVTNADWQNFVDKYLTPAFHEGMTILQAEGQWQSSAGQTGKERSRVVVVVYKKTDKMERIIESVRDVYKHLFLQESILRVDSPVDASF